MELVNLTPHELNIITDNNTVVLPPSGDVARVTVEYTEVATVEQNGVVIPLYQAQYGDVVGLPSPKEGVVYIVSGMVKAAESRADVVSPGELLRDNSGKPVGCQGLKI